MADFVQSFSQGVETGSSLMARAQQLKAQRERLSLEQQQEARLQALQPLALQERQMENMLSGMKIAQHLQDKAYQVEINKAFLTVGELLQHGKPDDPKTSMQILDALIKVPSAHNDPRFKAVMDALNNAQQLKMKRDQLMQPSSPLGKLLQDQQAASQTGNTEAAKLYDARIAKENAMSKGTRFYDPTTGNLIMEQGGTAGAGDLGTTTTNAVQQNIMSSVDLIDTINQLEPLISSETFGPISAIKGVLYDKLLANVPGLEDLSSDERATAAPLATSMLAAYIKANRSDSQIGIKELAQLQKRIPQVETIIESPAHAKDVMVALKHNYARKAVWKSALIGRPPPQSALNVLTPGDILEMNKAGLLSQDVTLSIGRRMLAPERRP